MYCITAGEIAVRNVQSSSTTPHVDVLQLCAVPSDFCAVVSVCCQIPTASPANQMLDEAGQGKGNIATIGVLQL